MTAALRIPTWTPPTLVFNTANTTTRPNVDALNRRVTGHIACAAKKSPADAEAYLTMAANHIGSQLAREDDHPALRGVSAFDIASAVEALQGAIPKAVS